MSRSSCAAGFHSCVGVLSNGSSTGGIRSMPCWGGSSNCGSGGGASVAGRSTTTLDAWESGGVGGASVPDSGGESASDGVSSASSVSIQPSKSSCGGAAYSSGTGDCSGDAGRDAAVDTGKDATGAAGTVCATGAAGVAGAAGVFACVTMHLASD
ncbi:hypothetical protein BCV70DRAFT_206597 [Testicularia cyperi]|uniref:Uncharacterized protein n=1 Tax=Testicularia cyperi TaxID=1882483 RepID=A0A317XMN0_9BASI|nr:hypothetical protein BCV70DRAFT_206597 [Testicularia cyperi]